MQKKHGPWTITGSEVKYKNNWMEVVEDKVIRPDGKPGIYGVVKIIDGVAVLPIDDDGFCYLTEEFHYAVGRETIEVVAGGLDKGEDSLEGAKRELKEELGIEAGEWTYLGKLDPVTSLVEVPMHLFIAQKLKFTTPQMEGTETLKMVKMKLTEAIEKVMKNEINVGSSCVLILKAKMLLESEKSKKF